MTSIFELKGGFSYAMHGNGFYKGLRQTNTLEALCYWHQKGVNIFEIDIAQTSDGDYIALAHYTKQWDLNRVEIFDIPNEESRTCKWFLSNKLFSISTKGLTPMSIIDIVYLLKENEDVIIMLDLFGLFSFEQTCLFATRLKNIIGEEMSLYNRLLLETYNESMVSGIRNVSSWFQLIACVRYESNCEDNVTVSPEYLLSQDIRFVSYPWKYNSKYPDEVLKYSSTDITVFSRTLFNNKFLQQKGVSVNIVACVFDDRIMFLQKLLYYISYIKRIFIKLLIHIKYK